MFLPILGVPLIISDINLLAITLDTNPSPPSNWILATGVWNDNGVWDDNAVWID